VPRCPSRAGPPFVDHLARRPAEVQHACTRIVFAVAARQGRPTSSIRWRAGPPRCLVLHVTRQCFRDVAAPNARCARPDTSAPGVQHPSPGSCPPSRPVRDTAPRRPSGAPARRGVWSCMSRANALATLLRRTRDVRDLTPNVCRRSPRSVSGRACCTVTASPLAAKPACNMQDQTPRRRCTWSIRRTADPRPSCAARSTSSSRARASSGLFTPGPVPSRCTPPPGRHVTAAAPGPPSRAPRGWAAA